MKKIRAFTLAETLTVLMIIGVVSAFVIPVLNANVEKQKAEAGLKRLYSSFSENIQTVLNEANCSSVSCLRAYPPGEVTYDQKDVMTQEAELDAKGDPVVDEHNEQKMKDVIEYHQVRGHVFANPRYINVIDRCGDYDCTPSEEEDKEESEKQMCNHCISKDVMMPTGTMEDEVGKYSVYRLNNGTIMALYNYGNGPVPVNCGEDSKVTFTYKMEDPKNKESFIDVTEDKDVCGIVVFDINATKGPNTPGKDLFAFYIVDEPVYDSYLVPIGYGNYKGIKSSVGLDDTPVCSPNHADAHAYNCTARIMLDGWKIKY